MLRVGTGRSKAITNPEAFGLPRGVVVFGVVLMAAAGFYVAGLIEKKFAAPASH